MDVSDLRRQAFVVWLRTGRWPSLEQLGFVETKFNPWHDPKNGQFTFVGSGRRYGGWMDGGFTGGGGGSVGGGGASGSWGSSRRPRSAPRKRSGAAPVEPRQTSGVLVGRTTGDRKVSSTQPPRISDVPPVQRAPAPKAEAPGDTFREVEKNGYEYLLDDQDRTRRVSGIITVNDAQGRSRVEQARAGGADRRPTDDGGHYIARRFNGPTDAFNHFAQHASFNRGIYLALENEWARAKKAGKHVTVKIVPRYDGRSRRPSVIDVSFWIDGHERSMKLPNGGRTGDAKH